MTAPNRNSKRPVPRHGGKKATAKTTAPKAATGKAIAARLEARIPAAIYDTVKHAAELKGLTVSAYVIDVMEKQARKDIAAIALIRLTREEQIRFAEALVAPPAPAAALKTAAKRYRELFGPE